MLSQSEQPDQSKMPAVILDPRQVAELQASVPQLVAQAEDLQVTDNDDYLASGSLLDVIDARQKKITEFFDEPAKQANNVHKFITSLRSTLLMPLSTAANLLKDRRRDYRAEKERERIEREEAERKIAKEQLEQQALQEAAQLEAIGESEAASTVIERAAIAPPPPVIVQSVIPKEKGHSVRKVFKFRIKNPALIKREFLEPAESTIQAIVSKLGPDAGPIVGGIEIYQDEVETIRGVRKA